MALWRRAYCSRAKSAVFRVRLQPLLTGSAVCAYANFAYAIWRIADYARMRDDMSPCYQQESFPKNTVLEVVDVVESTSTRDVSNTRSAVEAQG